MDNIISTVANNLRTLREQKKLSLDEVARLSGVSKSMLSQIERGYVNPTISTVWKIAEGLKISFTDLTCRPEADYEAIPKASVTPLTEDNGKFRNFPMFSFDSTRRFEMYYIEIDAGSHFDGTPHPAGTQEFITAFAGTLSVDVNGKVLTIESGGSMRIRADRPHRYANPGNEMCAVSMVVYYPKNAI